MHGYFTADQSSGCSWRFLTRHRRRVVADGGDYGWFTWQACRCWASWADRIPTEWGLGFAGTLALLGLTGSLLSDRATWLAAAVAGCAAVAAFALPFKLNIVVAIAAAVAVGILLDHFAPPAVPAKAGGR
jgi:predicted branched-subunit amino acid permease